MNGRNQKGVTYPQLLAAILIVASAATLILPELYHAWLNRWNSPGEMNIRQISYGVLQYMQDNDEQFPRAGFDCLDRASDPTIFKQGQRNQCGGNDWQDAISQYVKSKAIYVTPTDESEVGEGPWGGGTGTNLNASDGHFSLLYNDLLSHAMPTKSGGYADPAHQDKRADGIPLYDIKDPTQCLMLAEGHGGWDKCSTKSPPLLVVTDWTGSTDLQNKWHHDYTISGNYTGFMSIVDYSGVVTVQHGLPFHRLTNGSSYDSIWPDRDNHGGGGNIACVDGHQAFKRYSAYDGSPVLCKSIPWTEAMDPQQRNVKKDSCADPNNPVAAGWGGSNWF